MADLSNPAVRSLTSAGPAPSMTLSLAPRQSVVIGRDSSCDIIIKDIKASRRHCRLIRQPDGFLLEDLGSKNGTFAHGARIDSPALLKPEQTFKIGDTVFYLSAC